MPARRTTLPPTARGARWANLPADPKLLKDEDELRRIIDLIPHHIVVLDAGGTAIFVNQQVLEYTGLSVDEVRAGNFRKFHHKDVERLR